MSAYTYQRAFALFIDVLIVTFVSVILTIWIPESQKYKNSYKEELDTIEEFVNGEIKEKELEDRTYELTYIMNKETVIESLVKIVITIAYFGTYAYYSNGQTLGKKIMKIKVVSFDNKEVSHFSMLSRSLLINGVLLSIIEVALLFLPKDKYFLIISPFEYVMMLFMIISIFMVIFRNDKRGLHDFVCKTKVVRC